MNKENMKKFQAKIYTKKTDENKPARIRANP